MKILTLICFVLFLINVVMNVMAHNLPAVLGWSCATLWCFVDLVRD